MHKPLLKYVLSCVALALAYTLLGVWSLLNFAPTGDASLIWPASGLALGSLLLGGPRYWPGIVVGALFANGIVTQSWGLSAGIGVGNALGCLVGYYLLDWSQQGAPLKLLRPSEYFRLLFASAVAALVAALVGNLMHYLFERPPPVWSTSIAHWWQGDLLGIMIVTPLMIMWRQGSSIAWRFSLILEALAITVLTVLLVHNGIPEHHSQIVMPERETEFFILMVWTALRFGLKGSLLFISGLVMLLLWRHAAIDDTSGTTLHAKDLNHFWLFIFTLTLVGITLALKVGALAHKTHLALDALAAEEDTTSRFKQAQTLSNTGSWDLDIQSGALTWSDEIYRIFEINKQHFQASYQGFLGAIHPDDRAMVQTAYENSLKDRTPYNITHRLLLADGRIKWVTENCETYYAENGLPLRSIGTVQDITKLKQQEDSAIIANEARLRTVFNAVNDAMLITDAKGTIEMINAACETVFGYTQAELIGQNIKVLMPRRYARNHDEQMSRFNSDERSGVIGIGRELSAVAKNGKTFPIELAVNSTRFNDQQVFVGVISNITERKKVEAALREAVSQAEAANLAKSQFLATMSHELRTPLNSLLGMVQLVLMENPTERQRDCLQTAQNAGRHLLDIINSILDYTKIEAGKIELSPTEIDLPDLLRTTVALMQPHTESKALALRLHIDDNVPQHVRADGLRLKQVLINLIQNAVKFTLAGEVNVRVSDIDDGNGHCKLRCEVEDTGIGIAERDQHKLFRQFQQVDNSITRSFGGTGLGLAICKELVERMGGQIGVVSEPGKGSTFWFEIPCKPVEKIAAQPTHMPTGAGLRPLHGVRILLFETDARQQKVIVRTLLGRGALVSIATTRDALHTQLAQAPCQLLLLSLANDDHLDSLLAALPAQLPFIVLQPLGTPPGAVAAAAAHLTKPVTAQNLLVAVDRILFGGNE